MSPDGEIQTWLPYSVPQPPQTLAVVLPGIYSVQNCLSHCSVHGLASLLGTEHANINTYY